MRVAHKGVDQREQFLDSLLASVAFPGPDHRLTDSGVSFYRERPGQGESRVVGRILG